MKFLPNGARITPERARFLASPAVGGYVDVQVSLDGAAADVNDYVRGAAPSATPNRSRCTW